MTSLRRTFGPLVVVLCVLAPGVLAFWLLGVRSQHDHSLFDTNGYLIYRYVVSALVVVAAASMLMSVPRLKKLRAQYPGSHLIGLLLVYVLYALMAMSLTLVGSKIDGSLWDSISFRVSIVLALVHAALWPTVCVPWIVRHRISQMRHNALSGPGDPIGTQIAELLGLRRILNVSLATAASIISLAVIAAGQYNIALAEYLDEPPTGASGIVLFGMFFAGILAAFFVPVYLSWYEYAGQLRAGVYRIPADGRPDTAWAEGRMRLSDLLHLDKGVLGSLGPTVSILLPVIAALLGYFIPAS